MSELDKLISYIQGQNRMERQQQHTQTISLTSEAHAHLIWLSEHLHMSKTSLASKILIASIEDTYAKVQADPIQRSTVARAEQQVEEQETKMITFADWDRYNDEAKEALLAAQKEATVRQHPCIGTEYLLLGALGQKGDGVRQLLSTVGVQPEALRQAIEHHPAYGYIATPGMIGLTPRSEQALMLAHSEARMAGCQQTATVHILLGLLRVGEGVATDVLSEQGLYLEDLRTILSRQPSANRQNTKE